MRRLNQVDAVILSPKECPGAGRRGHAARVLRDVPGIRFAVTDARFGLLATDGGDVLLFWLIPALLRITSGRHFAADYCCVVTSRAAFFAYFERRIFRRSCGHGPK